MVSSANNKAACGRFNPSMRHPAAPPNEVLLRRVALISRGLIFEVDKCCQRKKKKKEEEVISGQEMPEDCVCRPVSSFFANQRSP